VLRSGVAPIDTLGAVDELSEESRRRAYKVGLSPARKQRRSIATAILHPMRRTFRAFEQKTGRAIRHPEQPDIPARGRYVWLFIWRLAWQA
jgi:hypothetical protein